MQGPNTSYGIILLAAGASRRLGKPKQLLQYKGETLLRRAIKTALRASAGASVVVLGAGAQLLMEEVLTKELQTNEISTNEISTNEIERRRIETVLNPHFAEGIASSIRRGLEYMTDRHAEINHVIFMLCDQPQVNTDHISALIEKHKTTRAPVVASLYAGRKGVPALFDRIVFPELLTLQGDTGAKHIIEKYGEVVALVPFPQGAVDIDTEDDQRHLE